MKAKSAKSVPGIFKRRTLAHSLFCAFSLAAVGPSIAQTAVEAAPDAATSASSAKLETVTVTARRRNELQLDVPISLRALSEKELQASGITNVADLATQTGFVFTSAQSTGAYGRAAGMVTFRGLQGELGRPGDSSGGVFLDSILITGGVSTLGMSDVSRVEVLKGPQNAFFGRSTFGGAVNFITRNPGNELKGQVNTTLNQRGSTDADASVEAGLIDNILTGRVTVASHNKTAEYRATDGGALGQENSRSVTGTLFFTPTDKLWMRLRGSFQQNDDSLPAVAYLPATGNTSCTGQFFTGRGRDGATVQYTPGTPYFCGSVPTHKSVGDSVIDANTSIPTAAYNGWVNNSLGDPFLAKTPRLDHTGMRSEVKHLSAQLGYALPYNMDLAVNVGYNQANTTAIFDLDKTKTANYMSAQITPTSDLTVDARLSTDANASLRGLVGVSRYSSTYQYSQIDFNVGATAPSIGFNYSNFDTTVPAIYGSVEYDLTDKITASLEARYQKDKVVSLTRSGIALVNETKNSLPRLTLRYKPNTSTSMYVNVAEGVQPLTLNSGYTSASAAGKLLIQQIVPGATDFTPQPKLTAVELGIKQRVGDRFQYGLAVYDQKWKDRLTGTTLFNPTSCGLTTGTAECPFTAAGAGVQGGNDARIRGLELTLDAQLSPQWSAGAYIDYKHAKWERFDGASQSVYGTNRALSLTGAAVNFNGNTVGRVPALTVTGNTTYRYALTGGWQGYVRGDVTHVGKQWESDYNFAQLDAYNRFDARLGFEKGGTTVELFVKNIADDRSWTTASRVPNLGLTPQTSFSLQGLTAIAQEERSIGVRLHYAF